METHSMKFSTHHVWRSLAIDSADSWRLLHCKLQHVLTPLCQFTRPNTSWLSCCCSQLLPLL
ncbi:unnamed protein product [Staurois parvus]|uniref:Uncharacterized protein n=1 Tax=Staurois parvus TaxID=386267 RepID=A0ABN9HKQ3_9NEOB|nr:unnamed protein product [Staurois parvus]